MNPAIPGKICVRITGHTHAQNIKKAHSKVCFRFVGYQKKRIELTLTPKKIRSNKGFFEDSWVPSENLRILITVQI